MFKKVVLFLFSPAFAVVIMVVPDVWALSKNRQVDSAKVSDVDTLPYGPCEKMDYIELEERGWKGEWEAIERIGEQCAIAEPTTGWSVTRRLWNRMFCVFLLPMACFAIIGYPLGFFLAFLDLRRLKKGWPPKYWPPFYAKIKAMEKHFGLFLVVWMSAAYYIFRYWTLYGGNIL